MPIAKVGEISIEYYVEGEGPPLLMIMGWIGHAGFWGGAVPGASAAALPDYPAIQPRHGAER